MVGETRAHRVFSLRKFVKTRGPRFPSRSPRISPSRPVTLHEPGAPAGQSSKRAAEGARDEIPRWPTRMRSRAASTDVAAHEPNAFPGQSRERGRKAPESTAGYAGESGRGLSSVRHCAITWRKAPKANAAPRSPEVCGSWVHSRVRGPSAIVRRSVAEHRAGCAASTRREMGGLSRLRGGSHHRLKTWRPGCAEQYATADHSGHEGKGQN